MAQRKELIADRYRVTIPVDRELHGRIREAATRRDLTVRQYLLAAIELRVQQDLNDDDEPLLAMTAAADPVLAELWDNPQDAIYDRL